MSLLWPSREFHHSLGGSEKFQDKQKYFYNELHKQSNSARKEQVIKVRRNNILDDVSEMYIATDVLSILCTNTDNRSSSKLYI